MPSAFEIARHLARLAAGEGPDALTPMSLHKLLYYCQGWALAVFDRPLFAGRLEAWKDGLVSPDLYPRFAGSAEPIRADSLGEPAPLAVEDALFLRSIWKRYGSIPARTLRGMTHDEPPWNEARAKAGVKEGERCSEEITLESLKSFFASLAQAEHPGLGTGAAGPRLRVCRRGRAGRDGHARAGFRKAAGMSPRWATNCCTPPRVAARQGMLQRRSAGHRRAGASVPHHDALRQQLLAQGRGQLSFGQADRLRA